MNKNKSGICFLFILFFSITELFGEGSAGKVFFPTDAESEENYSFYAYSIYVFYDDFFEDRNYQRLNETLK